MSCDWTDLTLMSPFAALLIQIGSQKLSGPMAVVARVSLL